MSNISPNHDTEALNQNVMPVQPIEIDENKIQEKENENEDIPDIPDIHPDIQDQDEDENTETHFSKNSIINISRKAGVKCISQCGIDKTRTILHNKIKEMSEKLVFFYTSRNGKTITKKMVLDFLESEQIHITHLTNIA